MAAPRSYAAVAVCVALLSAACATAGSGLFDNLLSGLVGGAVGGAHGRGAAAVRDFQPVQQPFNAYLSSLQLVLQTYTIDTHDIEITMGPVTCSKGSFGGASVKPDDKVVAINTVVSGLALSCEGAFSAKYKIMKAQGTMSVSVSGASMSTAVSPLKGAKPAGSAEVPDGVDMFGCSIDAGDVDIDFQGTGPVIALLEKLKDKIRDAVVGKVTATACEEIEKIVNKSGTGVLEYLTTTFLVPEGLK